MLGPARSNPRDSRAAHRAITTAAKLAALPRAAPTMTDTPDDPRFSAPLTISELNRRARQVLERGIPLLWVAGEVSNLTRAASGHVYFTLKDDAAQARCVMFRSRAQILPWRLENGQQVEARVTVGLYEPRGDFQLNVEAMRRGGLGRLFEAFTRLKAKLEAEGLFGPALKRPLPGYPRCIGVVSSPQAAALRDILIALKRRAPHVDVVLYPTLVQGEAAPGQIVAAIDQAAARAECDLLIVARGGGSIEDLWAFNDEGVARAIAGAPMPVISGVGHETDFTIADFAADLRAATPTAAAELATAGWLAAAGELRHLGTELDRRLRRTLDTYGQRIDRLGLRLIHPAQRLARNQQHLDHLRSRLRAAGREHLAAQRGHLSNTTNRLRQASPNTHAVQRQLERQGQRLASLAQAALHQRRNTLARLDASLTALDPHATLARGYSIVRDAQGQVVRNATSLARDAAVHLQFAHGRADARITALATDAPDDRNDARD